MLYLVLKIVHVIAVALFLGNIVTGLFWKHHGDRSGNAAIMAHTMEGIIRSDRWFTVPGVFLIIGSGVWAAIQGGFPLLRTPWIAQSLILFGISGAVFGIEVAPMQKRILAVALEGARTGHLDRAAYRRFSLRWEIAGAIAVLTPLGALAMMVLKRGF
jgi:uncharacterized membrane protein